MKTLRKTFPLISAWVYIIHLCALPLWRKHSDFFFSTDRAGGKESCDGRLCAQLHLCYGLSVPVMLGVAPKPVQSPCAALYTVDKTCSLFSEEEAYWPHVQEKKKKTIQTLNHHEWQSCLLHSSTLRYCWRVQYAHMLMVMYEGLNMTPHFSGDISPHLSHIQIVSLPTWVKHGSPQSPLKMKVGLLSGLLTTSSPEIVLLQNHSIFLLFFFNTLDYSLQITAYSKPSL